MDVSDLLKTLPGMGKTALCQKWQELFNKPAPQHLRKEFMVRILAYTIQENAFGGLSATTRRRLSQIATSLEPAAAPLTIKNARNRRQDRTRSY
jgi:hypothetical protein